MKNAGVMQDGKNTINTYRDINNAKYENTYWNNEIEAFIFSLKPVLTRVNTNENISFCYENIYTDNIGKNS